MFRSGEQCLQNNIQIRRTVLKKIMFRSGEQILRKNVQIRRMFNRADKDGSGSLTKEEWHSVLNSSGCKTSMYGDFLLQNYLWVQTSFFCCLVAMVLLGNDGDDERSTRQWLGLGDEYQSHGVAKLEISPRVKNLNKQLYPLWEVCLTVILQILCHQILF